jgi:hypothetical protein
MYFLSKDAEAFQTVVSSNCNNFILKGINEFLQGRKGGSKCKQNRSHYLLIYLGGGQNFG